jgi:TolB-like protein/tetratricopeptide (TPR) repeat protein
MTIPPRSPGQSANGGADGSEPSHPVASDPAHPSPVTPPTYTEFAAALNAALRDFQRPDLLARSPLLHWSIGYLGPSAGPSELQALLAETVGALFANARDEKLRRVIELTYFKPALKQEAVAERLSLPFSTYRRYLTTARDRLARWLWDSLGTASARSTGDEDAAEASAPPARDGGSPRLSIVVLPFVSIVEHGDCDRHADGITETLTTDLSRSPGLVVISRNTAFAYKGKTVDTRQVGRELGVRYVFQGSAQTHGDWMRINAQLVDSDSGAPIWAERFDHPCADTFKLQDEVTSRLARAIHVEMVAAESRKVAREDPDRLDSLDHTLRGWASWNEPLSLETARTARRFFEAALRLDADNVSALLGLADTHIWEIRMYESPDRAAQLAAAAAAATKALTLDPDSAEAHMTYGTVLFAMRAPHRALREFELAVRLNRNLAPAHGYLGLMKFFLGRSEETRAHIEEAMRLSPRDPLLFHWHYLIGIADVYLGRVVRGLENLRKSIELNPNWGLSQYVLAGALGLAGLLVDAADACAEARRLAPSFTIARFRAEAVSDNPIYLAQREHLYEGLRLAGAPER